MTDALRPKQALKQKPSMEIKIEIDPVTTTPTKKTKIKKESLVPLPGANLKSLSLSKEAKLSSERNLKMNSLKTKLKNRREQLKTAPSPPPESTVDSSECFLKGKKKSKSKDSS